MSMDHVDGHNLLFVVGCPRSGTTWVQRLLAAHPQVKTGQESNVFASYVGPQLRSWRRKLNITTGGRGGLGLACYLTEKEFLFALKAYLNLLMAPMLAQLQPGDIFLEKTPSHALFLLEILELLPKARFLHIVRNPRDVIASLLAASKSWGKTWAPSKVEQAAAVWITHVEAVKGASRLLRPDQFMEVSYEGLFSDQARTLRSILKFLNLDWDDENLAAAVATNSADSIKAQKGTKIEIGGEFFATMGSVAQEPSGFVRKGRPNVWREDLTVWERIRVYWALRKVSDIVSTYS